MRIYYFVCLLCFVCGPELVVLSDYYWLYAQKSVMPSQETTWDARDHTHVVCVQGKWPIHCGIALAPCFRIYKSTFRKILFFSFCIRAIPNGSLNLTYHLPLRNPTWCSRYYAMLGIQPGQPTCKSYNWVIQFYLWI